MFENVVGQPEIVGRLRSEVAAGVLPTSILFYGPPYSGKATAARPMSSPAHAAAKYGRVVTRETIS